MPVSVPTRSVPCPQRFLLSEFRDRRHPLAGFALEKLANGLLFYLPQVFSEFDPTKADVQYQATLQMFQEREKRPGAV